MNKISIVFTFFYLVSLIEILAGTGDIRVKYNFNPGWKVMKGYSVEAYKPSYNDNKWKNITLPYAWNEDDAFKKDIVDLGTGIAWYRKHFKLPMEYSGKKVF